jgi:hypothetical protein
MKLGEDLLLLAVNPRSGRVWVVERMAFALRAAELAELTMAERVVVAGNRISVTDPTPVGDKRLDQALASLQLRSGTPPRLDAWLRDHPRSPGMIRRYLITLAGHDVVKIERRGTGPGSGTRIVLRDGECRDQARARIDRVVRDDPDAAAGDRALAAIVHACGLDRHLYRGLRGRAARKRLAHLTDHSPVTTGTRAAIDTADAALADGIARALSEGIAKMTRELSAQIRHDERLGTFQNSDGQGQHHSSGPTHHGHHGGYGDVGGGHHH